MIFIPNRIKVGFCKRDDTYSGKLAYIIYYDKKGTLRKEQSLEGWRNKNIEPEEFDNTPIEGFVFNKKVGGGRGWDSRQTYTRVYDPRGFEIEITINNLLYILDNCDILKGKGISGELCYAWDKTELLLIPKDAVDYSTIKSHSLSLYKNEYIQASSLVEGCVYKFKDNKSYVYMGKYNERTYSSISTNKKFVFVDEKDFMKYKGGFHAYSSVKERVISIENEGLISEHYHEIKTKLDSDKDYIHAYGDSTYRTLSLKKLNNY